MAGNLLYISEDGMKVYHLWHVLLRDPIGNPLEAVICEELAEDQLPENLQFRSLIKIRSCGGYRSGPFENEQKKHKINTHRMV